MFSLNNIAIGISAAFVMYLMSTFSVQSAVAWLTLAVIGVYAALQVVKHQHGDVDYALTKNKNILLIEASAIGIAIMFFTHIFMAYSTSIATNVAVGG